MSKKHSSSQSISRRDFLGKASCAAIGSATLFSGLFNLKTASLLASNAHRMQPQGEYKALVCILLAGGNDSFNMLVPTETQAYKTYKKTRSNQALKKEDLLPIQSSSFGSASYGLHPSIPEIQQLFQQGKLSFLSNVGTLVEHVQNRQAFESGAAKLPLGLLSHSDQIMQWQTSIPQSRSANGWGGRLADLMNASNAAQDISMNISLAGNNVFQAGQQVVEYAISPFGNGSSGIKGYGNQDPFNQIKTAAVNNLLEQQYQDIFKQTYADVGKKAQESHETFSKAVSKIQLNTQFSPGYLSQSFQMIAKTIASREELGMNRQTFFVTYGGWDHHDELLNTQASMLSVLSKAMGEFHAALEELGVEQNVTTFSISDFARTLTSNGNGTDHGWGGNVMVMGGGVQGGHMFGTYPSLELDQDLDVGGGVLIPTLSTDQYFAELALWFGVSPSDLSMVLPNVGNFYDPMSSAAPIGFLL